MAAVIMEQLSLKSLVVPVSVELLTRIFGRIDFTLLKELVLVSKVPWEFAFEDTRVHKHWSLFKSLLSGARQFDVSEVKEWLGCTGISSASQAEKESVWALEGRAGYTGGPRTTLFTTAARKSARPKLSWCWRALQWVTKKAFHST